jgi:hypothetical protein
VNRATTIAAIVAAVVVETGFVWMLASPAGLDPSVALAVGFAGGYVMFFAVGRIMPSSESPSVREQLKSHLLLGLTGLLIAEAVLYLVGVLLNAGLVAANGVALAAVAWWILLGRPLVRA